MPIQGYVKLRKHQFGRQPAFGTKTAATKAYPFSGTPAVDLAWTDPEVDVGSRDPVSPPYRGAPDLTSPLTDPSLQYNSLPLLMSAFFGGGVVPTGSGPYSWHHRPASVTVDDPDLFTYEFGDDVLTDWYQLGDGILETLEITGPDGLGALTTSMTWRYGSVASTGSTDFPVDGTVPTPDLNADPTAAIVYLKDMGVFIADDEAGLAAGQVMDALHTFVLRLNQTPDQKRYANMDQSFDVDGYGMGERSIELELTFGKTPDTVGLGSESDHWMSDQAVNRMVRLDFLSKVAAATGPDVFYAWTVTMPLRYYTREEGDLGGNTTVVLMGHAFFDPAPGYDGVFDSLAVTTLAEADLGETPELLAAATTSSAKKSTKKTKAEAEPDATPAAA